MDEADEQFRQASLIDPKAAATHTNLGIASSTRGRDEAIDQSRLPEHFRAQRRRACIRFSATTCATRANSPRRSNAIDGRSPSIRDIPTLSAASETR